jgi:hypothetical protein
MKEDPSELWLGQDISEATGTRAVRQRSTSGELSPVRQYGFLSRLPRYIRALVRNLRTCPAMPREKV